MPRECFYQDGEFGWRDYEEPHLRDEEVRVESHFTAAKHGTELSLIKALDAGGGRRFDEELQLYVDAPGASSEKRKPGVRVMGNMTVGRVIEMGPQVKSLAVGDRVLTYGRFRPTNVSPEGKCWKIPDDMPWQSAVCVDPADFAMGALRDGDFRLGDAVAIFGMGAIGLMAIQLAKAGGAMSVIAVEPLPNRRALASALGADHVFDPTACDVGLEIKKATGKRGVDVAIDYSGSVPALQAALRGVAFGGTVVAGAFAKPYPAGLDLGAEAHRNIPRIVFSRACSEPNRDYPRWHERRILDTCLAMLIDERITGVGIVTPVVPFDDIPKTLPGMADDPDRCIKIAAEH